MTFTTTTCEYDVSVDSPFKRSTCRACTLREFAMGPQFHSSLRLGMLTPAYIKSLKARFGEGWAGAHEEIKAVAERIRDARAEVL